MEELNVTRLRKNNNLSQEEMAAILGITRVTYRKLEEGSRGLTVREQNILIDRFNIEESTSDTNMIPELPINAIGGEDFWADNVGVMTYDCEQVISPIPQAELAIRVSGDSMYPRYPNGCRVFVKKVNESVFIEWGSYYVLATDNGVVIKRVYLLDNETIECRSVNPDYQPFKVKLDSIHGWYKVLGSLHLE